MKDSIFKRCLDILKREDVKHELMVLVKPLISYILYEINPYIYITLGLVFLLFIMILVILVILVFLLRNNKLLNKML